jgi:hypothetical protein
MRSESYSEGTRSFAVAGYAGRMEVVCRGPFRAKSFLWQPPHGAFALAVICKATFSLAPGESPYHVEPLDVLAADTYYEDDPRRSIASASDFVPAKKHAEVLVTGHAHSPDGRAVQSLVVRVSFRDINKAVFVVGDSHIALDNSFSEPVPFTRLQLRWERSSSGPGGQNPVGVRMGREARADAWGRVFLPNLRPSDARLTSRWDVLLPAGFGPISPDWPPRMARLPHRARGWDPHRVLIWPVPPDFDMAFFNSAPQDQVTEEMTGDEQIVLENLLPGAPRFVTRLARLIPRAHAELAGGGHPEIELRCDTLAIDTDREIATLVWRGNVLLDHPERASRVIIAGQALTSQISLSAPARASVAPAPAPIAPARASIAPAPAPIAPAHASVAPAPASVRPPPPSAGPAHPLAGPAHPSAGPASAPVVPVPPSTRATSPSVAPAPPSVNVAPGLAASAPALPGAVPASAAQASPPAAPPSVKETIGLKGPPPEFVLPFGVKPVMGSAPAATPAPPMAPAPAAPPVPPMASAPAATPAPPMAPAPAAPPVPPMASAPAAAPLGPDLEEADLEEADIEEADANEDEAEPVFQEAFRRTVDLASWMRAGEAEPLPFRPARTSQPGEPEPLAPVPPRPVMVFAAPAPEAEALPREMEFAPPPTPEGEPPAPPPMWGPIQPQTPSEEGRAAADGDAKVRTSKSDSPPSFEQYPIERCARLAARIDRMPEEKAAILEKDELTTPDWDFLSAHWQTEIRREGARGKTQLLTAYDTAYVEELEAQRGPITAREYASLVVAAGRGTADDLIDEMALPRGSFPRIRRVWARKIVTDAAVAKEVRLATQAAAEQ